MDLRRHLKVLVALALAPALAAADDPPAVAPPATPEPAAVPAPRPAAPAVPSPRRVRFAATLGADFGFTDLLEATLSDGSKRSVVANQGFFVGVGAAFLPLLGGRMETQATLGLKYNGIVASNGSARLLVFPFELLETVRADPLRLAAGVVYLNRPKMSGTGVLSPFDVQFESSLGVVLQAEWAFRSRAGALTLGPRFIWQKLQVSSTGQVIDANAFGFVLSFTVG